MKRYIDADYLDELIAQLNHEGRGITRNEYKMIDNILFEFPTADVVERKKGKWIEVCGVFRCSKCEKCYPYATDYCPNCGAEMKGEDNDKKRS